MHKGRIQIEQGQNGNFIKLTADTSTLSMMAQQSKPVRGQFARS